MGCPNFFLLTASKYYDEIILSAVGIGKQFTKAQGLSKFVGQWRWSIFAEEKVGGKYVKSRVFFLNVRAKPGLVNHIWAKHLVKKNLANWKKFPKSPILPSRSPRKLRSFFSSSLPKIHKIIRAPEIQRGSQKLREGDRRPWRLYQNLWLHSMFRIHLRLRHRRVWYEATRSNLCTNKFRRQKTDTASERKNSSMLKGNIFKTSLIFQLSIKLGLSANN